MILRNLQTEILDYLKSRKPYSYCHLIQFERPIITYEELDTSEKEFVYLTDASIDMYFNDPRVDSSVNNLSKKYVSNRVIDVPGIDEYSEARATSVDLKLNGSAIGAYFAGTVTITSAGTDLWNLSFLTEVYDIGFSEGDKIELEINSQKYTLIVKSFPTETSIQVKKYDVDLPITSNTCYIDLVSEELVGILLDKNSPDYASFINREVLIYKVLFDEDGNRIGDPYYLYKGIIQEADIEDMEDGGIEVTWTLSSHWGDFNEVRGRITTDESHRALNESGIPQPLSAIKPIYAYDKGFIHSDTAVHLEATYTVQVEKQDVKYKKGFFGLFSKVKVKKYYESEGRQTELDFQLQGKTLDVIYGVRSVEGSPIFADTELTNSSNIYVAYSLCEGEVAGIYDIIISDNSMICNNEADSDARSTQTSENTVNVICYGRADRGDVLEGVQSTSNSKIDYYGTDFGTYGNIQSLSYLSSYYGFSQPVTTDVGSVGIQHENSVKINTPIDATFSFYAGRSNQAAAPNLVSLAQSKKFKIQNDYWDGDDIFEYWGPNHRLLDTAYAVGAFTVSENETTIPTLRWVVKGKFIPCYNYDNSFQHDNREPSENASNFDIGKTVDIYDSNDTLLDSTVRILDVKKIINNEGLLETRFIFDRQLSLGYNEGIPSITRFYMLSGVNRWTMLTYNHEESSDTVGLTLSDPVVSSQDAGDGSLEITIASGSNLANFGSGITQDGRTYSPALRVY